MPLKHHHQQRGQVKALNARERPGGRCRPERDCFTLLHRLAANSSGRVCHIPEGLATNLCVCLMRACNASCWRQAQVGGHVESLNGLLRFFSIGWQLAPGSGIVSPLFDSLNLSCLGVIVGREIPGRLETVGSWRCILGDGLSSACRTRV